MSALERMLHGTEGVENGEEYQGMKEGKWELPMPQDKVCLKKLVKRGGVFFYVFIQCSLHNYVTKGP